MRDADKDKDICSYEAEVPAEMAEYWITQYEMEKTWREAVQEHNARVTRDLIAAQARISFLETQIELHMRPDVRTRQSHVQLLTEAFETLKKEMEGK